MDQTDNCFRWRVYEPEGQIQEGTWGASLAGETLEQIEDLTCMITGRVATRMYQPQAYSGYTPSELIRLGVNYRFSQHTFKWKGRIYCPTLLQSTFVGLDDHEQKQFIGELFTKDVRIVFGEVWQKLYML